MRRSTSYGAAAVAALVLTLPALSGPATAAPARGAGATTYASSAGTAASQAYRPKHGKKHGKKHGSKHGKKLRLSTSVPGAQPGIGGTTVTAAKLAKKGKVVFTLNGAALGTVKAKKGKATVTLPALGTGTYEIAAKAGKQKGSTSFRVYQSALTFSTTSLSVTAKQDCKTYTPLTGSVVFKDVAPDKGYVDLYPIGSPIGLQYAVFSLGVGNAANTPVPAGTFTYNRANVCSNDFLYKIRDYAPGTYQFQAYYTPTPSYAEYIAANIITVTVT